MSMFEKILSRGALIGLVVLVALAGAAGFRLMQSHLVNDVYRQRLSQIQEDYLTLREQYNQAVRHTAVTELQVEPERVSVRIRTAEGVEETIPTDLDPDREIYVDFVVVDGRLWIRRLFDDATPPGDALVVNPRMEWIDWDDPEVGHGQAVYRRMEEGRWVVSVTGQGAMGLRRIDADEPVYLSPPPAIDQYEPIDKEIEARLDEVSPLDMLRSVLGI